MITVDLPYGSYRTTSLRRVYVQDSRLHFEFADGSEIEMPVLSAGWSDRDIHLGRMIFETSSGTG